MASFFSRNYRHWLWNGDVILIIDDVRAHTAGQMDWLLHYDGDYVTNADGSVRLKNGAAEAVVKVLCPHTKMREDTGLADHDPDKKVTYLAFSADAPERSQQFITAVCLDTAALPKFELLQGENYIGVRVETRDAVEETYLNLHAVNSPGTLVMRIGDWSTDAYMLHLKHAETNGSAVERYFVGDGSYLRNKDQSVLESLSKLTACWSPGDSLEIFSDTASPSIQIGAEHTPASVKWNGNVVAARYDQQRKIVSLRI
jgi:putative intracellular protease/amidase